MSSLHKLRVLFCCVACLNKGISKYVLTNQQQQTTSLFGVYVANVAFDRLGKEATRLRDSGRRYRFKLHPIIALFISFDFYF